MMSREQTIHTAMAISRKHGMSMDDAMMIAVESSMYHDTNVSPANETSYGASLGIFDRIISALKRAIQFIIRMIRELIMKLSKDANKKNETAKKIAQGIKNDTYASAKKIFLESNDDLTKCKSYVNSMMGTVVKVEGDVAKGNDSDLKIPESKVDPEAISTKSNSLKDRAEALATYTSEMEQRYSFDDKKINFQKVSVALIDLMPDNLRTNTISTLTQIEKDYETINDKVNKIYAYCKAKTDNKTMETSDRAKLESYCGKITRGTNHINKAITNVKNALNTQLRVVVT